MDMYIGIEPRLEQRLEQRLDLLMIQEVRTKADQENDKNAKSLKKFKEKLKEYNPDISASEVDFKILDKELQIPFEAIKERASVQDLISLCEIGLYANERGYAIAETFNSISTCISSVEDKLQIVRLGSSLKTREHDVSLAYNSLADIVKDKNFEEVIPLAVLEAFDSRDFPREFKELYSELKPTLDTICEGFDYIRELDELSLTEHNKSISLGAKLLANPERVKYQEIPLPIRSYLISKISEEKMQQANQIFGQKHLRKSTDAKRRIYRAVVSLENHPQGQAVLDHMFANFKTAEEIEDVSSQLELLLRIGHFTYYFEETDSKKLITRMKNEIFLNALKKLNLSKEAREKLSTDPSRLLTNNLISIISTYSGILDFSYHDGLPLLTEVTEHLIKGDFKEWRYSQGHLEKQLGFIGNAVDLWKENKSSSHIIGDISGISPTINVLHKIGSELKEEYKTSQKVEGTEERLKEIDAHINKIVMQIMQKTAPVAAVTQKDELVKEYSLLAGIVKLNSVSSENIHGLENVITSAMRSTNQEQMKNLFKQALETIAEPSIKNLHKVNVTETDDPYRLFDVGRTPVQSCQRWNESTGYNKCLLAYVADPNKKLFLIHDSYGRVIARSIVSLRELDKKTPMLLIERPYSTSWTPDYGIAIIRTAMEKASEISKVLEKEVAVASSAPEYTNIFKDIAKTHKVKVYKKGYSVKLAPSINGFEYTDTFRSANAAGMHKSGEKVSGQISYLFVDKE